MKMRSITVESDTGINVEISGIEGNEITVLGVLKALGLVSGTSVSSDDFGEKEVRKLYNVAEYYGATLTEDEDIPPNLITMLMNKASLKPSDINGY